MRAALIESSILPVTVQSTTVDEVGSPSVVLTFKQQKELLQLHMERDQLEMDKERLRQSLESEKIGLNHIRPY